MKEQESCLVQSQLTAAIKLMAQSQQSQTAAMEANTAALDAQTAALRELAASNRTLAKAMLDMPDDEGEEDSDCYLDGTPKRG